MGRALVIGTRGSPLALAQARMVAAAIRAKYPEYVDDAAIRLEIIQTSGDRIQDRSLSEVGGKGLFVKEIEEALIDGRIDMAVHSMKDVPAFLPEGLVISCLFPRESRWDALISTRYNSLDSLPQGARIGTSSLRRAYQIQAIRPDIEIIPYRGNVETRIRKLEEGVADATFLAEAGLNRLGMAHVITQPLTAEQMLPAIAQGAVGIEIRESDTALHALLAPLHDNKTATEVTVERRIMQALGGDCTTPVGAWCEWLDDRTIRLHGWLATSDGARQHRAHETGPIGNINDLGTSLTEQLQAAIQA